MGIWKLTTLAMAAVLAVSALTGCSEQEVQGEDVTKIALVHTLTGIGDKSMNDTALQGLQRAEEELGIQFTNVEPKELGDYEMLFTELAGSEEFDLIISLSVEQKDAVAKVSKTYPDQKFYTNSYILEGDNIASSEVIWEEFIFMAGYINAKLTTSGLYDNLNDKPVIGLIYAMDIPPQTMPAAGYVAGAKLADPGTEVLQSVVGDFQDISRAKELAIAQYGEGADIIQVFAGKASLGVINAAAESGLYASGSSVNQNVIEPDHVPHTTMNLIDVSIYNQIKAITDGSWKAGTVYEGIEQGLFKVETAGSNLEVPEEILEEAQLLGDKVVHKEIVIPKTMEEMDTFVAAYCK